MFFVGTYELAIDSKNRLSIPHPIRSKLNCDSDGRSFYVGLGQRRGTLAIYPERYFEKLRAYVPPAELISDEGYAWRQFEFSQSALLDPDTQGRILIPDRLLKQAGIAKDVTLIGVQDHLELWRREDFDAFQNENWEKYPERRTRALSELREMRAAEHAAAAAHE